MVMALFIVAQIKNITKEMENITVFTAQGQTVLSFIVVSLYICVAMLHKYVNPDGNSLHEALR